MRRTARPPQDEAGVQAEPTGSRRAVSGPPSGGPLAAPPNPSRLAKTHALGVCGGTSLSLSTTADRPPLPRDRADPTSSPPVPWDGPASTARRFSGVQQRAGSSWGNPLGHEAEEQRISYLVDPASSHMLVSKIKPCMSKYRPKQGETANGSLNQLWFIGSYPFLLG